MIVASRNHPDRPDDPLLASALDILASSNNTFVVKDWREIMAEAKKKFDPKDPFGLVAKSKASVAVTSDPTSGIDTQPADVVQLGCGPIEAMSSTLSQEKIMSETEKTAQELATEKAKAKMAEKAAKAEAAAQKKAEAEAAKAAKKAAAEAAKTAKAEAAAQKKAEAEAAKAAAKAEKAAKAAEGIAVEAGAAEGMSSALREKVQLGLYVKGKNGQLRSTDELALALETVAVADMVPLLLETLGLTENPYTYLNQGQQSMNLRNKLRGAIRKGTKIEGTETVITLDRLKAIRDSKFKPVEAEAATEKPSTEAATEVAEAEAA